MTYNDGTDQQYEGNIGYISVETIALLNVTTSRSKPFFQKNLIDTISEIWIAVLQQFGLKFRHRPGEEY